LLSMDFFKNAEQIDSSLKNSIEWISNAGDSLKAKMKEYESFFNSFNGAENKENFIKHLQSKPDDKHRLAYLHLVEPTLKEPDITLIFKDKGKEVKKEHIKAFQGDPKTIYYFLVTQDNDNKLITGLRTSENYIKAEIDKADIIHSFIPQARTLKE
ncbi:PBECR2 nuclease fold domain-containing protein, partial [Helicobacter pylori]|uniref:PBECR2 nuclease fold domain-containing protein n=1 Tax=Helicobacter pylori TaxID=210 RepID=UPI0036F1D291